MKLRDVQLLLELCVIAQNIYYDATHFCIIHNMDSAAYDSNLDRIQLAICHFLVVLIINVESKLLVRIYLFLRILNIEGI